MNRMLLKAFGCTRLPLRTPLLRMIPATIAARPLATAARDPISLAAKMSRRERLAIRRSRKSTHRTRFVVPARAPQPRTPRYSARSSRVIGRRPNVPKALSITPLKDGRYEKSEYGLRRLYLPGVFIRLVRNTGQYKNDPFTATFRTDIRLTKPDISNYLKNVYGLGITSIRTMNYLAPVRRDSDGRKVRGPSRKTFKKVLVTMHKPFWYPEEKSRDWIEENFNRDQMVAYRYKLLHRISNQSRGSFRHRGPQNARAPAVRYQEIIAGEAKPIPNDVPSQLPRVGQRRIYNIKKSIADVKQSRKQGVLQQARAFAQDGW